MQSWFKNILSHDIKYLWEFKEWWFLIIFCTERRALRPRLEQRFPIFHQLQHTSVLCKLCFYDLFFFFFLVLKWYIGHRIKQLCKIYVKFLYIFIVIDVQSMFFQQYNQNRTNFASKFCLQTDTLDYYLHKTLSWN